MEKQESAYINLLKKMLTDFHHANYIAYKPVYSSPGFTNKIMRMRDRLYRMFGFALSQVSKSSAELRMEGRDWPAHADTMIGIKRLENVEYCIREVVKNNVEGDVMELGVWRGGTTIFMRAMLKELNSTNRNVWVADSFEGLPRPDKKKYPADKNDKHFLFRELAVSLEDVKHNFEKYELLDDRVKFLKGWFKDTLPTAPIQKLAVLRLDGDMYESTMDGLVNLYPKLSKGGFLIVDDWGAIPACKKAVEDYRKKFEITEGIKQIDWTGVYWKKEN
jgi:O-methyltransferase